MNPTDLQNKTYDLLVETLKVPREKISLDSKLTDLTADSIQVFELVLVFEKAFALQSKYEDLIEIITVQDVIDYLKKHVSAG